MRKGVVVRVYEGRTMGSKPFGRRWANHWDEAHEVDVKGDK